MAAVVIDAIARVRARVADARSAGDRIGLVPTMGALHAGHARLVELARAECDLLIVSIFVNPLQFERPDDLQKYPRAMDADVALCSAAGVDIVFAPAVEEMYPRAMDHFIEVGRVAEHLCGHVRPGHFRGVATVVMKLLQIAQPDRAYFGEKDAQQLAVIRRMVADFNVAVTIVGVPTVREADGLAISSRNQRLGADERRAATVLYRALEDARACVAAGQTDVAALKAAAERLVAQQPGVRLEYFEVVDPVEMQPVAHITGEAVIAGGIWVGGTRLIDNVRIGGPA
jgi:pantoate--beta-alanine ligase